MLALLFVFCSITSADLSYFKTYHNTYVACEKLTTGGCHACCYICFWQCCTEFTTKYEIKHISITSPTLNTDNDYTFEIPYPPSLQGEGDHSSKNDFWFKSAKHGTYILALPDGSLQCGAAALGPWEKFEAEHSPYGGYAFFSKAHSKYIVAEPGGVMKADRDQSLQWESFTPHN
eukprot:UN11153